MEHLVVGHVVNDHVDQIVEVAGHQVAAHDLRAVGDRLLERLEGGKLNAEKITGDKIDPLGIADEV